jgi:hypothetical protein
VTVLTLDEGVGSTNREEPGSETWGADEALPFTEPLPRLAAGSDGSAVAVVDSSCTVGELSVACMVGAYRPPAGRWGPQEQIALVQPGNAITGFDVAAAGDRYSVVWGETQSLDVLTPPGAVRSADREAGTSGEWSEPPDIAALPADMPDCGGANCFDIAIAAGGTQLALWSQEGESGLLVAGALRDAFGATWNGADTVGPVNGLFTIPHGAVTASGVPVAAWGSPFTASAARGSHFEGGAWHTVELGQAPERGTPPPDAVNLGDLAADGQGDAVTAWRDGTGVLSAGFDATGPRFTAFGLPAGRVGDVLAFSAAAQDNWAGPAGISWAFGDGGAGSGGSVAHAYAAAGTFTATATATDTVGNSTEQSGPVGVLPR